MHADPYHRMLHYRAHHRGTREADALVGGYFDRYAAQWDEAGFAWFERLLEEQDVDIIAWAFGTEMPPAAFDGPMMDNLKRLDFIVLPNSNA
jgi:antitoxin CptB